MSSKSVERRCGKDGHWGPGLPRCKGDHHHDHDHNDDNDENDDNDDDNDDDEFDDDGDDDDDDDGIDYQPWHALYLGHFLPRDTLSNNHCPVLLMEIMMMMKILTMFTMMIVIINS